MERSTMNTIPRLSLVLAACSTIATASGQDQPASVEAADDASLPPPVEVSLPDTVYAVVGDTLQLFYRGMVKAFDPYAYNLFVTCAKGRAYQRYFEYTPTADDVGEVPWTLEVKDAQNRVLGKQTCTLVTKPAACSPATPLSVLCVGDSLTMHGFWCKEANRRLTGTGGLPSGLGLTNITFVGRLKEGNVGWEGTGGWSWKDYATDGNSSTYRFHVANVTTIPSRYSLYSHNGNAFHVHNTDIHDGSGTMYCQSPKNASVSAGVLKKTVGAGDEELTFTACDTEPGNPFWNDTIGGLDLRAYVDRYCGGKLDVVYFLLSWNGQSAYRTDFSAFFEHICALVDHLHTVYPDVAVKLMGIQVPSLNGGMAAYGAGSGFSDAYGMTVTVLNMNAAYAAFAKDPAYAGFVEFVNVSAQFDSENNMPEADFPVNCRNSKTEKRGTDGVHPSQEGHAQIADVMFRNFVAQFAQAEPLEERE